MRYLRSGIISAGILAMLLVTSLPVMAEAEYSKECIVSYIETQGAPIDEWIYDDNDLSLINPPEHNHMMPFWTGNDGIGAIMTISWGNTNPQCPPLKFDYSIDVWAANMEVGRFYDYSIYVNSSLVTNCQPYSDTVICPDGHTPTIDAMLLVWEGKTMSNFDVWINCTISQWNPQQNDWNNPAPPQIKYFWWIFPEY